MKYGLLKIVIGIAALILLGASAPMLGQSAPLPPDFKHLNSSAPSASGGAGIPPSSRPDMSGNWTVVSPIPVGLFGPAMASDSSYAYIAGGYNLASNTVVNTLARYD